MVGCADFFALLVSSPRVPSHSPLLPTSRSTWCFRSTRYLAEGDGVLELVLKAKRGPLGLGSNDLKLKRLLDRLLVLMPHTVGQKALQLDIAIRRAVSSTGAKPEKFETARLVHARLLNQAQARLQLPPFSSPATASLGAAVGCSRGSNDDGSPSGHAPVVPSEFMCPITADVMTDPVITADGMTYDRRAIEMWLREHDTSPLTGEQLVHKKTTPNVLVRGMVQDFCALHPELK